MTHPSNSIEAEAVPQADHTRPPTPANRSSVTERSIVKGLAQKPAYLLIFGICFLGLTAGSVLAATGQSVVSITLAFSVVVGLIAALVIILKIERPQDQLHLTGSQDIDRHLLSVSASLSTAMKIIHPQFRRIVVENCASLDSTLADIRNGQVRVDAKDYNRTMHDLLSSAQTSVFCVHRGDYLLEWFQRIGRTVIESHRQSSASATHLFVFDKPTDLGTPHRNALIKLDESRKVDVFVYFDQDDPNYEPPEKFPRDYVLIDGGDAICVTDRLEKDGFSGTWYFNDDRRKAQFNHEFSALKKESKKFSEIDGLPEQNQTPSTPNIR